MKRIRLQIVRQDANETTRKAPTEGWGRRKGASNLRASFLLVVLLGGLFPWQLSAQDAANLRRDLVVHDLAGPGLEVHFLDVGQGDSALLRTPHGKNFLVDCGPRSARKRILPYLKSLGIEKLDGIFISHSHMDHIGGLPYILDAIPVQKVYFSGHVHTSKFNRKLLGKLRSRNIELITLRRGQEVLLEESVKLVVYHPDPKRDPETVDVNDFSVVFRLSYGDIDFLFTGDSEQNSEAEILSAQVELHSEFLKVGHHGSRTATSEPFLSRVLPLFAVISCGTNNQFGHPHEETLQSLSQHGATLLRTDETGTVVVFTDGKKVMIKLKGKAWSPVSLLEGRQLWRVLRNNSQLVLTGGVYADSNQCVVDDRRAVVVRASAG